MDRKDKEGEDRAIETITRIMHAQVNYQGVAKQWHEFADFSRTYSQPRLNILEEDEESLIQALQEAPERARDVPPQVAPPYEVQVTRQSR